jgi:predicted nucleotidyltransferase
MATAKGLHEWQIRLIAVWASETPEIGEVRLFGSRWRGDYRPESDVDLAVTVLDGADEPGFDIYIDRSAQWEADLSKTVGLAVHLQLYEKDTSRIPFVACEAGHALLWP